MSNLVRYCQRCGRYHEIVGVDCQLEPPVTITEAFKEYMKQLDDEMDPRIPCEAHWYDSKPCYIREDDSDAVYLDSDIDDI